MTTKKRRHSDSELEPNPFLTSLPPEPKHQTVPAASSSQTPPDANPFTRTRKTLPKTQRSRLSTTSLSDMHKLTARGFDPLDTGLHQKIKKQLECIVRVFRDKGYAFLYFSSEQKADEVLARPLTIEGHPNITLSLSQKPEKKSNVPLSIEGHPDLALFPYQKPEKKSNVFDRLEKPKQPRTPSAPPQPPELVPPVAVFSPTLEDPRLGRDREQALFQLEQRDLGMRDRARQGETLVGTCEDMCPEKERYWREERHCLSAYELLPGPGYALDHSAAVKEFSRNAADKSQPLPHELRTPDALERTLLYLCHRVMPERPHSREWHGFLSNRLESLRQDMTIQHLCSLRSVRVLEACARFHALSAHLLLEAGMEGPDLEMNDMKLRSILTPLLQMYRDLRLNGVRSPHEPVFVSLSLVLAIETDLIAYDLLQVPDDVIASQQVQTVLQVWHAVHCDDYAQFFRILRRVDFLAASILNRFVPDLREKGLRLLSSASSKQGDYADAERLAQLLCFDDVTQCADVCSQAGLQCDASRVQLTGTRNLDASSVRGLPLALIRYKSSCELGESVYGGPLPPLPPRDPLFSRPPRQEADRAAVIDLVSERESLLCLESLLSAELTSIAGEVLSGMRTDQLVREVSEQQCAELLSIQIAECTSEVVRCEMAREVAERRRKEERAEFIARVQVELLDQLLSEVASDVARCEVDSAREHRALVSRVVTSLSEDSYQELECEVLGQLMTEEADSAVQTAKQRRKERLEQTRLAVRGIRLRNKWAAWRDAFVVRERRRESVRRFPILPPGSMDEGQWTLGPIPPLGEKVSSGELERVSSWLKERRERAENEKRQLATPVCIPQLIASALGRSRCQERTLSADWLLLLMVSTQEPVADWILEVLGGEGAEESGDHVRTLSDRETRGAEGHVRVRVRLVEGPCHSSHLKGCSAVLLVTGANLSTARERLELLRGVRRNPQVPLFILHTGQSPAQLRSPLCVSEVGMGSLAPSPSLAGRAGLEHALLYLAERTSPQPLLVRRGLREFVGDRMYALFSRPAAEHAAAREQLGVRGACLPTLCALQAAALSCVREQLAGRRAQELSWPVRGPGGDWKWNEEDRLRALCAALDGLRLRGESAESLEEFLSECPHMSPSLLSECHSLLSRHLARMKRTGLPLCPPWAHIIDTLMNAGMQAPEYDTCICFEPKMNAEIRLPQEWLQSLDQLTHQTTRIAPALRRKMTSRSEARNRQEAQNRKRHTEPLAPISPQELARKTAKLELDRSLARLEGMVREEVDTSERCTAHIGALIQSADEAEQLSASWEQQLQWIAEEVQTLRDPC